MEFSSLEPPYFHILVGDRADFGQCAYWYNYCSGGQHVVRTVRGTKMRSVDDLFDEFAAAFQFPGYFGQNWPAFDECMSDLEWLPAQGYIVMIYEAALLLSDDILDRPTFARIMFDVCKHWVTAPHSYTPSLLKPIPFHVLFHALEPEVEPILEFLRPANPNTSVVLVKDLKCRPEEGTATAESKDPFRK